MKKNYNLKARLGLFLTCFVMAFAANLKAQSVSAYTFSQTTSTYAGITGGTDLFGTSWDDNVSAQINLGFSFSFKGTTYSSVVVNSNGYITFGTTSPSSSAYSPISANTAYDGAVAVYARDLVNDGGTGSGVSYVSTGSAPNRQFIVQWTNARRYSGGAVAGDVLNFQIVLNETSNVIDLIYGASTVTSTSNIKGQVGLRGSANTDYNNRNSPSNSTAWTALAAGTSNSGSVNISSTVIPPTGLTFVYTPPAGCSGTPTAGTSVASTTLICRAQNVNLSLTGSTVASGLTYQWQSSPDGTTWTSISTATNITTTQFVNANTYYQAIVACGSNTAASTPIYVNYTPVISTVPYNEGFESITANNQLPNCSWLVTNTAVCLTYTAPTGSYNQKPNTGSNYASFRYGTASGGDYFYTNGIQLTAGSTYSVSAAYITDGLSGWSEFSLLMGPNQSTVGLTNVASVTSALTNTVYVNTSGFFVAPSTGIYYMAVKVIGSFAPEYLSFDDLSVKLVPSAPVINSVSVSPVQCTASAHTVTATITPGGGSLTSEYITYSFNGVAQPTVALTGGSTSSMSDWTGTIPAASPANANVTWTVTVTDPTYTKTTVGTPYKDAPLTGLTATASASPNPVCAGSTTTLSALPPVTALFGAGSLTTTASGSSSGNSVSPFSHYYGGGRFQYMIRASELTAQGIVAGSINSVALDVAAVGISYNGFAVNMTQTTNTDLSGGFVGGLVQVYSGTVTPTLGINTYTFSSPYMWDGTSNLVIQMCWSNNNGGGTAAEVRYDNTPFVSEYYSKQDNATPSVECSAVNVTGSNSSRPKMTLVQNKAQGLSFAWSDGTTTVGTTSTLVVSPSANTTYSATLTDGNGCSIVSAPVTVTVTPLPSAPTVTNSSQCGVGVPTAQVGGGSSYNWYATGTSTAVLQGGSSNTYTSSISSTTTFYVSSLTGICESPRSAVTVTVSIPDGVVASTSSPSLCPGGSATLTAVQSGTNNPYVFTWSASPSTGSGITGSVSGATTIVMPTIPGTYAYSVTATDGICTTISSVNVTLSSTPLAPVVTPTAAVSFCLGGSQTITAVAGTSVVFTEPFETFPLTQFTTTGTGVTTSQNTTYFQQGSSSAMLTYASSSDGQLAMTSDVNLSTYPSPKLSFYQICATEAGYDYGYVQYSTDGGTTWTSFPTSSYQGSGTLKNGVVSFDKSSYTSWNTQFTSSTSTPTTGLWQLETIDLSAYQSSTQFRVRFRITSDGTVNYYGWLIDNLKISAQFPANFSWAAPANAGLPGSAATPSASNGSLVVTPTAAGAYVYTATATNAGGCQSPTAMTATVTVNPLPSAPVASNSTQCGLGVPTASVSGSTGYIWYGTPTSTVVLQSGASATYTTAINTSTTFYVSSFNGTCESATRTAVTVTVTTPDAVTASATSSSLCPGQSSVLMVTQTGSTNVYSYTWTASPAAGSGIPTSATGTSVSVMPTQAGSYVYTVTASDGLCTTTSTINITSNPAPNISNVTATPSVICSGATVNLNAASINGSAGTSTVGTQSTTDITGGPFRSGAGSDNRVQYVFTAAELNAAGIQAGNITALSFNVTSLGSGTMNNWMLKIGATSASNLTTTFDASPLATVYGPVAYTAVSGLNTFTFATPFNWDGTSNVIVQVCHDATNSGSSSISMTNSSNTCLYTLVTGACTQTSGTSNGSERAMIVFNGIVGTNVSSSINWMWNPGAIASNTATVNPTNSGTTPVTQTYTITATDPVTTCTNSATASVTVNPLPAAPSVFNSLQCGVAVPTASVSGSTSYNWYNAATAGTLVQSGASQTYTGSISSTTTFYVSSFNGTCEGPRAAVTASVNTPDAISASVSSASICPNTAATLSVTQTGSSNNYSFTWTASPAAGSGIPTSASGASVAITPSLSGVFVYTVTGVDGVCTAVSTTTLTVFDAVTTPPSVSAMPNPVCAGSSATLTGAFSGSTSPTYALPPAVTYPTTDEDIGNVTFGPLNNTTAINSLVGTIGTASGTAGSYSDFTAFGPYAVTAGNTYSLSVDVLQATTAYDNSIGVYIDFNRNGVFTDAGEEVYTSSATTPGAHTETANIMIPANAARGLTRMRVLVNEDATTVSSPTQAVDWGEYEEYMLNIQPNVTYSWSDGTSTIGTTNPIVVTPTANTTYSFSITDGNGCSINSTATTVTVNPVPTVTAVASSSAICAGSTATLTASGATSYTWTPGNQTLASIIVAPNVNTTYTLTGATAGCAGTATVALVAIPLPTVTASASNTIICSGNTVTITANGATNYTWTPGGLTTTTIAVTPTVSANYTVSGSNGTCAGTGTVHITVNNVPTLSVTPASPTICAGSTTTLTGNGATSYTWSAGSTTNTAVVTPTANTTYTLTGSNSCGTSTTTAMVSVVTTPTVTAVASTSLLCAGSTATITASGASTYSWSPGGATTTTIVVTPTASVTYSVRGTNACGTATTVTTISLSPTPTVTAVSSRTSICSGDFAVLTAGGATNYTWTPGGLTTTSITVTPTVTTSYVVTGKTSAGCTSTATVNQLVLPCTGINEVSSTGIDIYPNPNVGSVNVSIPGELIGRSSIEVYDAIGKLVIKENLTDAMTHLNTSRLEEGLYIYKIFDNNGVAVKIGRMVRNK